MNEVNTPGKFNIGDFVYLDVPSGRDICQILNMDGDDYYIHQHTNYGHTNWPKGKKGWLPKPQLKNHKLLSIEERVKLL